MAIAHTLHGRTPHRAQPESGRPTSISDVAAIFPTASSCLRSPQQMCGICGVLSADPRRPADVAAVRRMADALAHRGPDAAGFHADGPVALGHRRLAIIDLSKAAEQPILSEDGAVAAVVNGEIYNHLELRRRLESRGHLFRSRSDAEVVVHLYEEHGEDLVGLLRGMFAIAVWDRKRKRLVLARDR